PCGRYCFAFFAHFSASSTSFFVPRPSRSMIDRFHVAARCPLPAALRYSSAARASSHLVVLRLVIPSALPRSADLRTSAFASTAGRAPRTGPDSAGTRGSIPLFGVRAQQRPATPTKEIDHRHSLSGSQQTAAGDLDALEQHLQLLGVRRPLQGRC